MKPPNGEGGLPAAVPLTNPMALTLAHQLRAVNGIATEAWSKGGWRMLDRYIRTGKVRHLAALECHVAAMIGRVEGVLS